MTVADVTGAGGAVEADESARTWTVEPRAMQLSSKVTVEPDLSNAGAIPRRGIDRRRHGPGASLA